jgi:hypothetical protein
VFRVRRLWHDPAEMIEGLCDPPTTYDRLPAGDVHARIDRPARAEPVEA